MLYDVMHSPLDDLIVAPRVVGAADARDLLHGGVYPVTEEGANLQRKHRVSRRLVEDPVLYLFELAEEGSLRRSRVARRSAEWLGLEAERRREGTALIDGDFEPLSDVRFPAARPWTRQVALLLAEAHLPARPRRPAADGATRTSWTDAALLRERWGDALCCEEPAEMAARGLEMLEAMRLVRRDGADVMPLAAIARFNHVDMTAAQQRLEAA